LAIVVVGLGPGPAEWVTPAAASALRTPGAHIFVRTALHPAVEGLLAGRPHESFDALYEEATSLEAVHVRIAGRLVETASDGRDVVLAVPGDGTQGEAVLSNLVERGVEVRIVPGVAVSAAAAAAVGMPATEGLQAVEASMLGGSGINRGVELNPLWPAVVGGVYNRRVASEVKLALQRVYPPGHVVTVVRHPGLPDEQVTGLPLAELDRGRIELDHLTHLALPAVPMSVPTGSAHSLRAIVARLRAPGNGCPWDLEQTHRSLIPFVIEEAYEVVDAIEEESSASLLEELGDLLLQIVLHAEMADQEGDFDWNDVVRTLSAKLVRRHPHVFGEVRVESAADVVRNWDALKAAERADEPPHRSALEGVPKSLPALKRAAELGRKAVSAGFDWPERAGPVAKVREELEELLASTSVADQHEEYGDLLWMLANLAVRDGVDPEEAVRSANRKFSARFQEMERIARKRGWDGLRDRSTGELQQLWQEAKQAIRSLPEEGRDE
jgi:tetrapyrrole methylase family protein / MazG family protein